MKVGWIGLGHMGLPTARTIATAGHCVTGYDIRPIDPAEAQGLAIAASASEAAEDCDVLCLALFSDEQVEAVLNGPDGLFPTLKEGTVVAIFTTGTIASIQRLAAAAPAGVALLDTCFSRQNAMIPSGKLNILVGGDAAALARCRPVLEPFANEILHVGTNGAGRALKLVNNLLWVAHTQLAKDALVLAEGLGLDPLMTAQTMFRCSGASDAQAIFGKPGVEGMLDYMHPFMVKDASAAAEAAREAGVDLGTLGHVVDAYCTPQPAMRNKGEE